MKIKSSDIKKEFKVLFFKQFEEKGFVIGFVRVVIKLN